MILRRNWGDYSLETSGPTTRLRPTTWLWTVAWQLRDPGPVSEATWGPLWVAPSNSSQVFMLFRAFEARKRPFCTLRGRRQAIRHLAIRPTTTTGRGGPRSVAKKAAPRPPEPFGRPPGYPHPHWPPPNARGRSRSKSHGSYTYSYSYTPSPERVAPKAAGAPPVGASQCRRLIALPPRLNEVVSSHRASELPKANFGFAWMLNILYIKYKPIL